MHHHRPKRIMACSVCSQSLDQRRRACCASCGRATLYGRRIQQISTLLQRENFHTQVEAILRPGNDGVLASLQQDANWDAIVQGIKSESHRRHQQELEIADDKVARLLERVGDLKRQMVLHHDYLDTVKQSNEQRKSQLESRKVEYGRITSTDIEPLDTTIRKARQRLERVHHRSADAKAYLCYTASSLAGVKQEVDQRRKLTGRIMLAGLILPDLRELSEPSSDRSVSKLVVDGNIQQYQHINHCLDNTCRLIAIWAHYLSTSVPAEIILPHNDFPHAAVLPEKSSYRGYDIPYPGGSPSQNASPSTSRVLHEAHGAPRPRVLHLDRPLAKLAKEDTKAFGLFVEGVVLLAWDLAWLCKTQGVTTINTFDECCDIGRNLWLFHRAAEARALQSGTSGGLSKATANTTFGSLTHGTVLHSLAGYEGAAVLQNWRLAQPYRLVDKLRSFLLTEMTGAEWDVLSDGDFDDDGEDEVAVLVGGHQPRRSGLSNTAMSVMSVAPLETHDITQKNDKGWMKVRGRVSET